MFRALIGPQLAQHFQAVDLWQVQVQQDDLGPGTHVPSGILPGAEQVVERVGAITRDNHVYLGANQIDVDSLGSKVADMLQNKTNKLIYLRADARSQYGKVEDAIDSVRTAGVDQIGLLTEKKQTQ